MTFPKKSLGQHFLTDKVLAKKIVDLLDLHSIHTLIEVGPGRGALTEWLKNVDVPEFYLIEYDREMVVYLQGKYPGLKDALIHADFLEVDLAKFKPPIAIIGNFPYNISSQILFKIYEHHGLVQQWIGMFQKEVALRLVSPPGSKQYGLPGVLLGAWYEMALSLEVAPGSFYPPPRVRSGVVKGMHMAEPVLDESLQDLFFKIVKKSFNQRRKMLRTSLKGIIPASIAGELIFTSRPEQLSARDFIFITRFIYEESKRNQQGSDNG